MIAEKVLRDLNDWDVLIRTAISDGVAIDEDTMLLVVKCGPDKHKPHEESVFELRCVLTLPTDTMQIEKDNYILYSHEPDFNCDFTVDDDEIDDNSGWSYRRATTIERLLFCRHIAEQYKGQKWYSSKTPEFHIPNDKIKNMEWMFGLDREHSRAPLFIEYWNDTFNK